MIKIYKIIFTIIILLLFLGTVVLIALGNPWAADILNKTP